MKFTVAICTWNRSHLLAQTLSRLTEIDRPSGAWEVIVIDNNSTDNTSGVARSFAGRLPLRVIQEMAQGLSHARNAATREARGSFIAWTDDDVLVDPGWLRAYELAIDRHPDATIFGGPIEPWFEGTPPTWLLSVLPRVSNAYALCDLGPNVMRLEPPDRLPFGANFVLRTEAQRTAPYDLALGRVKNGGALGEEHDVLVRLLAHGHIGYWIPEARVRHWLPRQRQSTSYLRRYYALSSRTQALGEMSDSQPTLFSRPRWAYRVLAEETAKYTWRRLRGEHSWVDSLIAQSYALGRLKIL